MEEGFIDNRASEVPFAGILADLLTANLTQRPEKRAVYETMRGAIAIELTDIETAVTLFFASGKIRIEEGIVGGLPWYFDGAGRRVLGHLFSGRLKIEGLFSHPVLLTQLTKIMSVM